MADARRRVLICGYGAFGALHAAAWRQMGGDIALMVADPGEEARARARADGIAEADIGAESVALMERADLVDIVAPPAHHLPLVLQALDRGKPVLVEKPAVRTVGEAEVLVGKVAATGLAVQVGLVLRCHPLTGRARALLTEGAIGNLLAFEGDFSGWKRMRADASILENDGVHFLDLMRFLAGAPPVAVDARAASRLGGAVADDIRIELAFGNGISGHLRLGILAGGETEDPFVPGALTTKRLRLIGDKGNLVLDFNRNRLFHGEVGYAPAPGGWNVSPGAMRWEQVPSATPSALLARSFQVFLDAAAGRGEPLCPVREGTWELARVLAGIERALARPVPASIAIGEGSP